MKNGTFIVIMMALAMTATTIEAQQAGGTDHAAAIKQSLQHSAAALRHYQWVETTVVSIKGKEKMRTQNSCLYGVDGQVQKTPIGGEPEGKSRKMRGLRGRIAKRKKAEIKESVQEAIALVKEYVPPDPARIQTAKEAEKLTVVPLDQDGNVKVTITDYLKDGDSLSIGFNAATNVIAGLTVATFTDRAKHAVGLEVAFESLTDGTVYPATINLDVAEENLRVVISRSGYEKIGN
jgi:hypothetical protein